MGVKERGEQFRRLARTAIADLFDQRSPFGRLALTHVLMTAGDTVFAVSLAGSLFFSISPTAAKDKVLLYLLLTMAPFAVVAPALGPLIDRSRGARRGMLVVSALGRIVLCPFLARDIHSLLLFPEAFAMLVLSKVYLVTKGALVPEMAARGLLGTETHAEPDTVPEPGAESTPTDEPDLASLNARLGLLASLSGFVFALPAIAALKLGGAPSVIWLDMAVFVAAMVAGFRLPVRGRPVPSDKRDRSARGVGGDEDEYLDEWDRDELDLASLRPLAPPPVALALMPMSVLKALAGFLEFLFAFGLRRQGAATWWFGLLLGAITVGALAGVLLMSRLRRVFSEQQILVGSLWLVVAGALIGAVVGGRIVQVVVAVAVGIAGAVSKPSFDALVQRHVEEDNRGRAFARFETQFQLVWVVGAFLPVVLTLPIAAGNVSMAAVAAAGAVVYMSSLRSVAGSSHRRA